MHKWLRDKMTIKRVVEVTIMLSAEDWELYNDENGADLAAFELNRHLEFCVKTSQDKEEVRRRMDTYMSNPVYRKYGANDTEPRAVLDNILDNIYG